jgi:hypothetical protein
MAKRLMSIFTNFAYAEMSLTKLQRQLHLNLSNFDALVSKYLQKFHFTAQKFPLITSFILYLCKLQIKIGTFGRCSLKQYSVIAKQLRRILSNAFGKSEFLEGESPTPPLSSPQLQLKKFCWKLELLWEFPRNIPGTNTDRCLIVAEFC